MDSQSFMGNFMSKRIEVYYLTNKSLYSKDFKSSLTIKLSPQEEIDKIIKTNSNKTGKELALEYIRNDIKILQYGFRSYIRLIIKTNTNLTL